MADGADGDGNRDADGARDAGRDGPAEPVADGESVPPGALTLPVDASRQAIERATAAVERASVAPEQAARAADVEVGQTPSEVVHRENKLELHRYEPLTDGPARGEPVLIVYALINRPYILDLQPDRSVVRRLLEAGFEVYLIDWGEPSTLDSSLTLEDYVDRYVDNCVREVCRESGVESVNLLGYCMGGTMSAMYAALYPERVRTLSLMAAGLCFAGGGGVLELWGDERFFDPDALVDTYDNVPAEFFSLGFDLMDPIANTYGKYVRLYENLPDEEFVENFARMERWLDDGIDVAGATYEQFIREIYQENALARGEFELGGQPVDLGEITMPVLQIVGEYDHLVPPEASTPFNDLVGSDDTAVFEQSVGHIGLSVSSRSHDELWPAVAEWLGARQPDADSDTGPATGDASASPSEPDLEAVNGIGSAYAARLRDAGIGDLRALAAADAASVADAAGAGESRAADWIEQARGLVEAEEQ